VDFSPSSFLPSFLPVDATHSPNRAGTAYTERNGGFVKRKYRKGKKIERGTYTQYMASASLSDDILPLK